jgi:hypothetical protein
MATIICACTRYSTAAEPLSWNKPSYTASMPAATRRYQRRARRLTAPERFWARPNPYLQVLDHFALGIRKLLEKAFLATFRDP